MLRRLIEVQEPWWRLISTGHKKVEGRKRSILRKVLGLDANVETRTINERDAVGTKVWIQRETPDLAPLEVLVVVAAVRPYATLHDYLDAEGWQNVLPDPTIVQSRDDAINEYHKFFSDAEIENEGGMVALELQVLS